MNEHPDLEGASTDPNLETKSNASAVTNVSLPSYAAWFRLDQVHEIERKSLPEFFSTDAEQQQQPFKNESLYKEYRDFMIHTYRLNPSDYLSVTTCRRHLVGDAGSILRVHSFLDQWGLINYQQQQLQQPGQSQAKFKVTYDLPRGMATALQQLPSAGPIAIANISPAPPSFFAANPTLLPQEKEPPKKRIVPSQRLYCSTCNSLITENRYHCLKKESIDLCCECFLQGRFPSSLYSGDFVRLALAAADLCASWSDQEKFLLLEGIEMHGSDWQAIADYVGGGRSKEQCVQEFLSLPITDRMLIDGSDECQALIGDAHPVLSVVSYLASLVHPNVSAAAAKAAIQEAEKLSASPADDPSFSPDQLASMAGVALGAAATRAKALAESEEKLLQRSVNLLLELFLKKLDLKMKQLDEIEKYLQEERSEIEQQRSLLFQERIQLRQCAAMMQQQQQQAPVAVSQVPAAEPIAAREDLVIAKL